MTYAGQGGPDAGLPPRSVSNIPVPDPSLLTTESLNREISHLRELLESQVAIVAKELANFKSGLEDRYLDLLDKGLGSLKEQMNIQFDNIEHQLVNQIDVVDKRYEHRYDELKNLLDIYGESTETMSQQTDLRYQQRFDTQKESLAAAFEAQQIALTTAMASSDKSVQAALSAVDKATITAAGVTLHRFEVVESQVSRIATLDGMLASLASKVEGLDRLTDAKYSTLASMVQNQAEKVALSLQASDRAVTKAETATEKRFENDAAIRSQLQEQGKTYMTRGEASSERNAMVDKVGVLEKQLAMTIPRSEAEARWTTMTKQIDDLRLFTAGLTGTKQGSNATWGAIAGGIGLLATIIGIIAFIAARTSGTTP